MAYEAWIESELAKARARKRSAEKLSGFAQEARSGVQQGFAGALSTQTASNVARFGLTGTGVGAALTGLTPGAISGESLRMAYEREIQRLMSKAGMSREKAIRHLGIQDPRLMVNEIQPTLTRLQGAARLFAPTSTASGTEFGTGAQSGPLASVSPPSMFPSGSTFPGLMGPNPLRLT